jgi:hypothetical protein
MLAACKSSARKQKTSYHSNLQHFKDERQLWSIMRGKRMNVKRMLRLLIVMLAVLVISLLTVLVVGSMRFVDEYYDAIESGRCKDDTSGMTPEELSRLTGVPLATFTYLPDEIHDTPKVHPRTYYPNVEAVCGLAYVFYVDDEIRIEVEVHEDVEPFDPNRSLEDTTIRNCFDYDIEFAYESSCVGTISDSTEYYTFTVLTQYGTEVTRKIARGMVISDSRK